MRPAAPLVRAVPPERVEALADGAPANAATPMPAAPASGWVARGLLAVAVIFLLDMARPLLLPVVIAVVFTFVLAAPVRGLRRLGLPASVGAALVVLSALSAVLLAGSALADPAAEWWERAPTTVRQIMTSLDRVRVAIVEMAPPTPALRRPRAGSAAPAASAQPAPVPRDTIVEKIASEGVTFTRVVIGQMLSFVLSATATVILLYFLLASEHWLVSRTVEALPRRRSRAQVLGGIRQAQREVGLFLGTMSLINLGLGVATALAVGWIGLPNPALWGAVAAVANFVPYFGPAMVAGMLLLAGNMSFGAEATMLAPPAAFLALHAIESNLVTPYVVGRRLRLSPVAVFLSVMFWGWLWGIAGALIAVPMLLALRAVCKRSRGLKLACVYLEGDRSQAPSLHSLLRKRRPK